MKKKNKVVVVIILCVFISLTLFLIRSLYLQNEKDKHEEIITNGVFSIKTKSYELDDLDFITFYIEDDKGNVVFVSNEGWRKWDFKDIYFINDTNDIYVYSADVGTTIYKFTGETWIPDC